MTNKFSKFINLQGKYLTSLLILLALSIGNVWGADPDLALGTDGQLSSDFLGGYSTQGITLSSTSSFSSGAVQIGNTASAYDANYFEVLSSNAEIEKVSFLISGNGSNKSIQAPVFAWATTATGNTADTYVLLDAQTVTANSYTAAQWFEYDLSGANVKCARIYRTTKNISSTSPAYTGSSTALGSGQTIKIYGIKVWLKSSSSCTAPTNAAIAGTTSYTEGDEISLIASADGATSATFTWYKGADWATASTGSSIATGATLSINPCATTDAGTYWCNISNGTGCEVQVSKAITVDPSAAAKHDITYTNTKGADNTANPTQYTEGVGVASFEALADVTDFHFTGWSPASIAADATTDQTIDAQWVAAYNVTFNAGVGGGTVPDAFQKWEGGKFNLPGQGSMTHATKVFDGWKANGAGDKLAADAEYTMGNADVEFVAQWKAAPVTIFHWKSNTSSITMDATNGTTTGGTTTLRTTDSGKSWGNESVTYNASVADDMKGETSGKELKPGGNANYLELALTSGTFQEGDVIYVTGYNNWAFLTSTENISSTTSFDVANIETGSTKTDAVTGSATIPAGVDAATIYARRANGSSSGIAAIKVTRIVKDIISTVNTLTDVKVGESSISVANLATLVSEHSLALSDALASAPTITFNQHTVITYEDYSTKTSDTPIPVVASDNGAGKWTASTTIDAVTYTVTLNIATGFAVTYNANGGSGTMTDATLYAEGDEVTVLENTFTSPAANKKFNGWTSSPSVTISEGKFEMPASDVTLSAQWKEFFVITYMDGSATLGTEDVFVGDAPVGLSPAPTKPLFSFAGWKDELDADVDVTTLTAAATVYAKWNKAYASSVDLEGLVESEGTSADWQAYMSSHNFAFSTSNVSLDAKASGKTYENWPYQGLKAKEVGAFVEGRVNAGKLVIIKLGHMAAAANVSLDGVAAGTATGLDAAEPAGQLNYFYAENEALLRYETTNAGACVLKAITIQDPYTVSFEAHGDADPSALPGQPSVTLPNATNGTASLLGWFTEETGGTKIGDAGDTYTPTDNITLHAQWESVSTDARLASITFSSAAGTLEPAFNPEVVNYTYTMPYPTAAVPTITGATSVSAKAKTPVIDAQAANWGDVAHIHGVAESDDTKDYYITMKIAPKDGVSIIKVATTGGTNKTVTGLYAGDGDVNLSSSTKMDDGKFIGFILDGTTLQAGDRINVHTTTAANTEGSHIIFYDNMTDKNELYETGEIGGTGDNIFVINAAMEGATTAYVYRSNADNAHKWNGYVDFIEVTRAMNPVLTAITFDGVDAEPGVGNTFSALLPNGTNLASMTVVPTIVKNGEGGSAAPTAAWAWGDNTYRVTDKDGDFTDYTITLTEAAAPSAAPEITTQPVGDDYIEGATIDALEVVATGSGDLSYQWFLGSDEIDGATNATYTPTVTAIGTYVYHCVVTNTEAGHPATSLASSNATITIAEDPAAIKLLDNEGEINTTNFTTGVSKGTVTISEVSHNCASFGSTGGSIVGLTGLNKVVAYNATTTQTKVKFILYNENSSPKEMYLQKVLEGATEAVTETIAVPSKEYHETQYYEYNSSDLRSFYVTVNSTNIKILQVKVIDNGTVLKRAGEVGYELNLNQGRVFGAQNTATAFEGLAFEPSSNAKVLNSTELPIVKPLSFTITAPLTLAVTTSAAKYYVSQNAEEDGTTATAVTEVGEKEFDLTVAGTWYIVPSTSSAVKLTNIAFSAPKCAEPAFNSLVNSDVCEGDPYVALNGTATVADAGGPTYQWYKEDNTPIDGATNAEYTPTEDGKYYVIAINHLEGFSDNEKKSDLVTVATVAGTVINVAPANVRKDAGEAATLTVDASGKNLHYAWKESDTFDGTYIDVAGADDAASLDVTVPAGVKFYKVVVSSDCGADAEAIAKVEKWVVLDKVDVTATTEWDWVNAGENNKLSAGKNVEILMANIRENDVIPTNDATFNSQALLFYGENVRNVESGRAYASVGHISFNTTVPGAVFVEFSDNGSNNRRLSINGKLSEPSASKTYVKTFMATVPAGEVVLMGVKEDGTGENQYIRISKITFVKMNYTREVNSGRYGTICLPNGGKMYGGALYEVAYKDETKIYFDEILNGEMVAGRPYIFLPNAGIDLIAVAYTDEANAEADSYHGLIGFIGASPADELPVPDGEGNYILQNNQYREVLTGADARIKSNRAYIKLASIGSTPFSAPAGRRRISMGYSSENAAQGFENLESGDAPMKVMINGTLYILRGEKVFDATGRLVK